ncbi:hypothetical protein ACUSIJ_25135 [Pseudochelatococcus sp. B33]
MALTPDELAAINTLNNTTGNNYPGDPGGLGTDGHRVNFVPALGAVAKVGQAAAREAGDAATAAASASAQAASLSGTSTTSVSISAGSKTLTTQSGKAFSAGSFLLLTSNASPTTHYILGQATSYSGTSLIISVVSFAGSGSRADWTIRVAGGPGVAGADGKQVELQTTATHIQWRLADGAWTDLVALADLRGDDGTPIEVQASATHIQWRYVGGSTWTDIIALSALKGDGGDPGPRGAQIINGARDPVSGDGANGDYWLQSADGTTGELGDFWSKSGGTWTKLFNMRGAPGEGSGDVVGPNGGVVDGEIMLSNGTTGKVIKGSGLTIDQLPSGDGTVTSVALALPTGFTVTGSPVTGSGTLTGAWDDGYQAYTTTEADKLSGIEESADVTNGENIGISIRNTPSSTLEDARYLPFIHYATSALYKISWENVKSTLKTYFDTLFEPLGLLVGINTQTGTSYTLALADAGRVVERNNSSANTVTVPANATVAFPIGTRIDVFQVGTGQTTIAAASGVTIRSADSKLAIAKQYGGASLYKRATNEWLLIGGLS